MKIGAIFHRVHRSHGGARTRKDSLLLCLMCVTPTRWRTAMCPLFAAWPGSYNLKSGLDFHSVAKHSHLFFSFSFSAGVVPHMPQSRRRTAISTQYAQSQGLVLLCSHILLGSFWNSNRFIQRHIRVDCIRVTWMAA